MFKKPLKGGQAKEDEVDRGEGEEEPSFGEKDNVCHSKVFLAGAHWCKAVTDTMVIHFE